MLAMAVIIPVHFVISFFVAEWLDRRKRVGFWWALLFNLTLTAIVTFCIVRVIQGARPVTLTHFARLLWMLAAFACFSAAAIVLVTIFYGNDWWYTIPVAGITALGIYITRYILRVTENEE